MKKLNEDESAVNFRRQTHLCTYGMSAQFVHFPRVVNLPLIHGNLTGCSNAKLLDWMPHIFATLESLDNLSSVVYGCCDLVNSLY